MSGYLSPWMYGASSVAGAVPTNGFLYPPGESPYTIPPEALKALAAGGEFIIPAGLSPGAPDITPQTPATYPWADNYGLGTSNANMGSFSSSNPSLPTSLDLNNMTMSDRAFVPNGVSTTGLSSFDSGAPAPQTFMQKLGGWASNGNNLQGAAAALGALTQAWMGYQGLKTARDQISFQKKTWQKNFENQTKTYNTRLEDRIRGRTADYGGKENDVQSYLNKHKLST